MRRHDDPALAAGAREEPEGDGKWKEHASGYSDWLRQRPAAAVEEKPAAKAPAWEKARVKLSHKETRELETLPGEIVARFPDGEVRISNFEEVGEAG